VPIGWVRMGAEIVQLRREQLAELGAFLKLAYPDEARKSLPDYLEWYFLENPHTDRERLPLWVVRNEGKIVGQVATIPVDLKAGSATTKAIWILEFILLPEFRGQGLGKRLVLQAGEENPTMITLGINEASTRVFTRLGWKALGGIHRYHRMLFAGTAAQSSRPMRAGLDIISSPLRMFPRLQKLSPKYEIHPDLAFGPEMDELWERAATQWPAAVRRGHKLLRWQFLQQPGKKFEVLKMFEKGKLIGYAVLFFRKGQGSAPPRKAAISDLVYDAHNQDDVIDGLLGAALEMAIERRAGSLVTDVLDARLEARLKADGFWRIAKSPRFMASSREFQHVLYHPENWYLTRADSDVSIFEEPNVTES
jgi:GNAT superfamily N-acetyltransferase